MAINLRYLSCAKGTCLFGILFGVLSPSSRSPPAILCRRGPSPIHRARRGCARRTQQAKVKVSFTLTKVEDAKAADAVQAGRKLFPLYSVGSKCARCVRSRSVADAVRKARSCLSASPWPTMIRSRRSRCLHSTTGRHFLNAPLSGTRALSALDMCTRRHAIRDVPCRWRGERSCVGGSLDW